MRIIEYYVPYFRHCLHYGCVAPVFTSDLDLRFRRQQGLASPSQRILAVVLPCSMSRHSVEGCGGVERAGGVAGEAVMEAWLAVEAAQVRRHVHLVSCEARVGSSGQCGWWVAWVG